MSFAQNSINIWILVVLSVGQLIPFVYSWYKLWRYSKIFPFAKSKDYHLENNLLQVPPYASTEFQQIVDSSNQYLLKNESTADYTLLKDIAERRLELVYQSASSVMPMPMYLGLMGTFLGVGYGLSRLIGVENTNSAGIQSGDLSSFLGGVVVAMMSSFIGLLLIICSNLIASYYQKKLDTKKDAYLSFIQTELLPEMGSSLVQSLSRLKNTIGGFELSFTRVINRFESTFGSLTEAFGTGFRQNIDLIHEAVNALGKNMYNISETMMLQKQVLAEMRSLEMTTILESIFSVFTEFKMIIPLLQEFQTSQKQLNVASAQLTQQQELFVENLKKPVAIIKTLNSILDRISKFEESINTLGESISDAQYLGKKQIAFIEEALKSLEQKQKLAARYTETGTEALDSYYSDSISNIEKMRKNFETQIRTAFDFQLEGNSFKHLQHLVTIAEMLPAMRDEMETLRKEIIDKGHEQSVEIINAIKHLKAEDSVINSSPQQDGMRQMDWGHKSVLSTLGGLFKGKSHERQ